MSNKKFFCSDLHFSHSNIVKYTNRGVETTQEQHDEWLIDLWNSQVNSGDIVYHMGDFSFAKKFGQIEDVLKRLNGTKKFIYGNHDGSLLDEALSYGYLDSLKQYDEIKLPELNGQKLVLFHYPIGSFHHQARGNWHLHGHCLDDETEILTDSGFKRKDEVNNQTIVATFNIETANVEYQQVIDKISRNFSGNIYQNNGKSLNFCITDGHNLLYKPYHKELKVPVLAEVKNITSNIEVPVNGENTKEDFPITDDYLRLALWITTDGSFENNTLVRFHLKKERKIVALVSLLDKLGIKYSRNIQKTGNTKINFTKPAQLSQLKLKPIDRELLINLSSRQVQILIEIYKITDGCVTGENSFQISTSKEDEADLLQEVLVTSGINCNKIKRPSGNYILSANTRKYSVVKSTNFEVKSVQDFPVWCVSVPNKTIFIRRAGKVMIIGNCHGQYKDSRGKMLDVGLDNAYNLYGKHRFFSVEDLKAYMDSKEIYVSDHHKELRHRT